MTRKKKEWSEWINQNATRGPFLYIFENDIRRNVFKILDTSFARLCLKTPNTTFGRGCVF